MFYTPTLNKSIIIIIIMRVEWRRLGGDWGDLSPPIAKSRQKLSMKNGTKLVGYTVKPEIIHTHATFEVF